MATGLKTVWKTALTEKDTTDVEGVGRLRVDEQGNCYRWGINAAGASMVLGSVVHWGIPNGAAIKESFEDGSSGGGDASCLAGVSTCSETVAVGEYCWIQTKGYNDDCLFLNHSTQTQVGGTAIGLVTAATLVASSQTRVALAGAPTHANHLSTLEVSATSGTVAYKVLINCENQ